MTPNPETTGSASGLVPLAFRHETPYTTTKATEAKLIEAGSLAPHDHEINELQNQLYFSETQSLKPGNHAPRVDMSWHPT